MFPVSTGSQMAGDYTIHPYLPPSSTNFQSFGAATSALETQGVRGPVVFKVYSTAFNEAVRLNPVTGASVTSTVTFVAEGIPATISPPIVDQRYGIYLANKTRWIRFENIRISGYIHTGIYLDGDSTGSTTDCIFTRMQVDDGATVWPRIRALCSPRAQDNQFIACVFRSNFEPVCYTGAQGCVFDRCEFDGKGLADRLVNLITETGHSNRGVIVQNCFLHDCGPAGTALTHRRSGTNSLFLHNTIVVDTSDYALHVAGGVPWAEASIFKNNLVVNLGTGPAVRYGYDYSYNRLDVAVTDTNCFYKPNGPRAVLVGTIENPVFAGNLAGFLAWQAANPARIVPGGAPSYESHSLETDPRLETTKPPVDFHLTRESPLIAAGTTDLIPSYVNSPPWMVATDFDGDDRVMPVDIGADEAGTALVGLGTGAIGTTLILRLFAQHDFGLSYQMASALGPGPNFIGGHEVPLDFDAMLFVSINGYLPTVFLDYAGRLDSGGRATARIAIPDAPPLRGVNLHSAFLVLDYRLPYGIRAVSNAFVFVIR